MEKVYPSILAGLLAIILLFLIAFDLSPQPSNLWELARDHKSAPSTLVYSRSTIPLPPLDQYKTSHLVRPNGTVVSTREPVWFDKFINDFALPLDVRLFADPNPRSVLFIGGVKGTSNNPGILVVWCTEYPDSRIAFRSTFVPLKSRKADKFERMGLEIDMSILDSWIDKSQDIQIFEGAIVSDKTHQVEIHAINAGEHFKMTAAVTGPFDNTYVDPHFYESPSSDNP